MKKILANRVYADSTLKKWSKEDLIELIRILEHNWASAEEKFNNSVKNSDKIFAEQKAEIERLTNKNYELKGDFVKGYEAGVDEGWDNAVQNTAEEIIGFFVNKLPHRRYANGDHLVTYAYLDEIAKRYGVKVD